MQKIDSAISTIIAEHPKFGPIKLLNASSEDGYLNRDTECDIEFINTGYMATVLYGSITSNNVKDYLYPSVCGVGCLGYAKPSDNLYVYEVWRKLIAKCYNPNNKLYKNNGAKGFFVCPDWLIFSNFLDDYLKYNNIYNEDVQVRLCIKPELLKIGYKEYSFENCDLYPFLLDIKFNTIYHSNQYGDFMPLEYARDANNRRVIRIRFIKTGYETLATATRIINGDLKDPYYPSVSVVGYLGETKSTEGFKREYVLWRNMLRRCYDVNDHSFQFYGAQGVTVCERWHCFTNFIEDIKYLPNYNFWKSNETLYELDKDYLQQGVPINQMIYSPQTCIFIPSGENNFLHHINMHNKSNSEYYGVRETDNGNFAVKVATQFIATYSNAEAAANARDWRVNWQKVPTPLNFQQPTMQPSEWLSYRVGAKSMMNIVGPMKDP